jgi:methylthioribose-1-phosphate isomerase
MSAVEAVRRSSDGNAVDIIDQRVLPGVLVRRELRTVDAVCDAIATLAVRGAPAIGVAGAMGLVVALQPHAADDREAFLARARKLGARIARVRPTAVNLSWAVRRLLATAGTACPSSPMAHAGSAQG